MKLTVLGDEGDAAVDHDGDAVPAQLLVAERPAVGAGGLRDGGQPQGEVHGVEAAEVNRPGGGGRGRTDRQTVTS